MSDQCDKDRVLTNIDLHREQERQSLMLKMLCDDVKEIKSAVLGSDSKPGLVLDVDRLKRSRALINAVLWVVFTGAAGTGITVLAAKVWPQ